MEKRDNETGKIPRTVNSAGKIWKKIEERDSRRERFSRKAYGVSPERVLARDTGKKKSKGTMGYISPWVLKEVLRKDSWEWENEELYMRNLTKVSEEWSLWKSLVEIVTEGFRRRR